MSCLIYFLAFCKTAVSGSKCNYFLLYLLTKTHTMSNLSLRLFTPTEVINENTDSLESLTTELGRINNIYISNFHRCCEELKNVSFETLINELEFLCDEQDYKLKLAYNISTLEKSPKLLINIRETIQNLGIVYKRMIYGLNPPQ